MTINSIFTILRASIFWQRVQGHPQNSKQYLSAFFHPEIACAILEVIVLASVFLSHTGSNQSRTHDQGRYLYTQHRKHLTSASQQLRVLVIQLKFEGTTQPILSSQADSSKSMGFRPRLALHVSGRRDHGWRNSQHARAITHAHNLL